MKEQEFWAWYDNKKGTYHHLYPRRFQVEVCASDGFKRNIERGEGRIVRVKVRGIEEDA